MKRISEFYNNLKHYSKRILLGFLCSLIVFNASLALADVVKGFEGRTYSNNGFTMQYRLFKPLNYDPAQKYAMVIFLHGLDDSGSDNRAQISGIGTDVWIKPENQAKYPCFVLAPQNPKKNSWYCGRNGATLKDIDTTVPTGSAVAVLNIINLLENEFSNIDATRLYLTGLSMGGNGTWEMYLRHPEIFAAALPCSGVGDQSKASRILNKPLWAFHGSADPIVPVNGSRLMIDALRALGGNPKYTEYPGVEHNSWDHAYMEPDLLPWTFAQKLGQTPSAP